MKINRFDQAKILSPQELHLLFNHEDGLRMPRDKALFAICLYTGARIGEACQLSTLDVYKADGSVRPRITLRKNTTKGKQDTRSVPVSAELRPYLEAYSSPKAYLFPGRWGRGHLKSDSADQILREALERLQIEGVSTHSFRRTCLTTMHRAHTPLKVTQKISGHRTLAALQRYLEVLDEDLDSAIATLNFQAQGNDN
jgi:integrase/recombinase XerD